jgi:hypothetical protein
MIAGLIVFSFPFMHAVAQNSAAQNSLAEQAFVSLIESDEKQGEWVFYTQRFLDKENKWARYKGSIYAAVKSVKITGCRIDFDTVLTDHFTGLVGKSPTREQQDSSSYSISFTLTRSVADALEVIEAPPIQLRGTTNAVCEERPSCALTWLRIRTKRPEIAETVLTNDFLEFRGTSALALLPLSSSELGRKVVQQLRSISDSHCQ